MKDLAVSIKAVNTFSHNVEEGMATAIKDVNEEENEMLLCIVTDTIVHPRTMMIHSGDTVLADRAVMTVGRLYGIAFLAFLGH